MDFLTHPAYATGPPEPVANAIAIDFLRKVNIDDRPRLLSLVRDWRPEVYEIIVAKYPQHC